MPTSVGNYGRPPTANLVAPKLKSYGDALNPLINTVDKLNSIAEKKAETQKTRDFHNQRDKQQHQWQVDAAQLARNNFVADRANDRTYKEAQQQKLWTRQDEVKANDRIYEETQYNKHRSNKKKDFEWEQKTKQKYTISTKKKLNALDNKAKKLIPQISFDTTVYDQDVTPEMAAQNRAKQQSYIEEKRNTMWSDSEKEEFTKKNNEYKNILKKYDVKDYSTGSLKNFNEIYRNKLKNKEISAKEYAEATKEVNQARTQKKLLDKKMNAKIQLPDELASLPTEETDKVINFNATIDANNKKIEEIMNMGLPSKQANAAISIITKKNTAMENGIKRFAESGKERAKDIEAKTKTRLMDRIKTAEARVTNAHNIWIENHPEATNAEIQADLNEKMSLAKIDKMYKALK